MVTKERPTLPRNEGEVTLSETPSQKSFQVVKEKRRSFLFLVINWLVALLLVSFKRWRSIPTLAAEPANANRVVLAFRDTEGTITKGGHGFFLYAFREPLRQGSMDQGSPFMHTSRKQETVKGHSTKLWKWTQGFHGDPKVLETTEAWVRNLAKESYMRRVESD